MNKPAIKIYSIIFFCMVMVLMICGNAIAAKYLLCDATGCSVTQADTAGAVSYSKVAIVAASGGNFTDPKAAMDSLSSWCGVPSAGNPCLIKVLPGVYNIGANSIQMSPYVDIEGSGEEITKLTANNISTFSGTINGASEAEIRQLTIENITPGPQSYAILNNNASVRITRVKAVAGGGNISVGIRNYAGSSAVITDVTATASGSSNNYGISNDSSAPTLRHVTAIASGGTQNIGVFNALSSPVMMYVTATASGGTINYGIINSDSSPVMMKMNISGGSSGTSWGIYSLSSGTIKLDHSTVAGVTGTIYTGTGVVTMVGNSRLEGEAAENHGTLTCVGIIDEAYVYYPSSCP